MSKKTIIVFIAGIGCGAAVFALAGAFRHGSGEAPVSTVHAATSISTPSAAPAAVTPPQSTESPAFHLLLSREPDAASLFYPVKKGDSLTSIARSHGTTADLIKKMNALAADRLSIGQRLKIPSAKFNLVIDKSQNTLILKAGEEVLKTYVVSTGSNNSTPVGVFKVMNKLLNPTWYKSGAVIPFGSPENVLGTRWIGLTQKGYGIHGTTEPDKLGRQVTAGCVRMRNDEVEELFGFVVPGTEVTIVD